MTNFIFIVIGLTIAANAAIFLIAYLRYKRAAKKARQAKLASILPTAQTLNAKEQKAILDKHNSLFFGCLGLAYNKARAKGFKCKDEAEAELIYDRLCWSDVCFFALKDSQTLRQFVEAVVAYCLPLWAFDQKQVEQTTALICEQLDFILSFEF